MRSFHVRLLRDLVAVTRLDECGSERVHVVLSSFSLQTLWGSAVLWSDAAADQSQLTTYAVLWPDTDALATLWPESTTSAEATLWPESTLWSEAVLWPDEDQALACLSAGDLVDP